MIRDNLGYGGGIYAASSVVNIENTTITNNSGEGGSGLRQDRGTVNIINTTISGNAMTERVVEASVAPRFCIRVLVGRER